MLPRPRGRRRPAGGGRRLFFLAAVLTGCASAPAGLPETSASRAGPPETAPTEPVPAVFTAAQATRGERVFTTVCGTCHGPSEFTGPIFALTWMAEPVGHLFQHISTAMPQDRPGSLSAEEYAAIIAHLLQLNGRRAGDRELPADAALLDGMRW